MFKRIFGATITLALMAGGAFAADHDGSFVMENITNHIVDTNGMVGVAQDGTILNLGVIYEGGLPEGVVNPPRGNRLMFASEGGMIDDAIYQNNAEEATLSNDEEGPAQIVTGIWQSPAAVAEAMDALPDIGGVRENGFHIQAMDGSEVTLEIEDDFDYHPNLDSAIAATEVRAKHEDWKFAFLLAGTRGRVSTLYFTPNVDQYGIAMWGDRVAYKAWTHNDKHGESWSIHPTEVDGEKTLLLLERGS